MRQREERARKTEEPNMQASLKERQVQAYQDGIKRKIKQTQNHNGEKGDKGS